jgi:hypothetical protein
MNKYTRMKNGRGILYAHIYTLILYNRNRFTKIVVNKISKNQKHYFEEFLISYKTVFLYI